MSKLNELKIIKYTNGIREYAWINDKLIALGRPNINIWNPPLKTSNWEVVDNYDPEEDLLIKSYNSLCYNMNKSKDRKAFTLITGGTYCGCNLYCLVYDVSSNTYQTYRVSGFNINEDKGSISILSTEGKRAKFYYNESSVEVQLCFGFDTLLHFESLVFKRVHGEPAPTSVRTNTCEQVSQRLSLRTTNKKRKRITLFNNKI